MKQSVHGLLNILLLSTERHLACSYQLNVFNEEFDTIVARCTLCIQKIDGQGDFAVEWAGTCYMPLTKMYKKGDNVTTPLRICSNLAMMYKFK